MPVDLRSERARYARALEGAIERAAEFLGRDPRVERVVLIGSAARGCRDLFTDLDLVVVMETDEPFHRRAAGLLAGLGLGVDVDLLVYTPEEFERMRRRPFLARALEHGRLLHAKHRG